MYHGPEFSLQQVIHCCGLTPAGICITQLLVHSPSIGQGENQKGNSEKTYGLK